MSKVKIAVVAATAVCTALGIKIRNNNKYDENGYNKKGYNKEGYNRLGYNKAGYDRRGYNAEGYDKYGYNARGYDKNGRDRHGYNADGYDISGYDKDGFNVSGYDKLGYNKQGYNSEGKNRDGKTKEELLKESEGYLKGYNESRKMFSEKKYMIPCMLCRKIVQAILYNVLEHYGHSGSYYDSKDNMEKKISFNELIEDCLYYRLIDDETAKKLHQLRIYGNVAAHEDKDETDIMQNQCYFVIKETEEMIDFFKEKLYLF